MDMDSHLETTVQDSFLAPAEKILPLSENTRECMAFTDLQHLRAGVGRVIENAKSGRDWLQRAAALVGKPVGVGQFFDSLKSPRRLELLGDINAGLAGLCDGLGDDPFAEHPELDEFAIYASDGHYQQCSAHEEEILGKRRPVGHFFSMNLRTQAFHHLDVARPDIAGRKKAEHDITVLKRLGSDRLRFGQPKGIKVIHVYDRAVVDFAQWQKWKQSKGIYVITREKENMRLQIIGTPAFDRDDPRNAGVVADQLVGTAGNRMIRRILYVDPVSGKEYAFLTNEMTIPPGLVAYLYKRRWNIEKVFDQMKNKLEEGKVWAKSDVAKCQQALFQCIAHNLLLVFEDKIKQEEGIEDRISEGRRKQRKDTEAKIAKTASRPMAPMLGKLHKCVQRSMQFIRWLRMQLIRPTSWRAAMDALSPLMARYLS